MKRCAALLLCTPCAFGQSPAPAALPPVTIPAVEIVAAPESDDGARRNASIAMSIYGRDELDRQGDLDLTDVLKRLPGISMDSGAPRLRGLGGGYTQILINGDPAPPGFSLETLAPADVERIEVIKGATAEYSGVAGTINVVLREPPKTQVREWRANLSYRAVQPGGSTAFQWGDKVGDMSFVVPLNVSRSAAGTSFHTDRISRTSSGEVRGQAVDGRDASRTGSGQLAPRVLWRLNDTDTLSLNGFAQRVLGQSEGERSVLDVVGSPSYTVQDQTYGTGLTEVRRVQGQWQRKWTQGGKMEFKASWQHTLRRSESDYTGWQSSGDTSLVRHSMTDFDESRASAGSRINLPVGESHSLAMGWDVERRQRDDLRRVWDYGVERVDSSDGVPFSAYIERGAMFLQDEWALSDQWAVLPGVRLEEIRTHSGGSAAEIDNLARVTAPVLHINYRLDPKGRDQVRASITRSFKLPELASLMGRYVFNTTYEREVSNTPIAADRAGNPSLRPELSTGVDIALEHYPQAGGVLSISYFYRNIDDLIRQNTTLESVAGTSALRWVSRPLNIGQAQSQGLELELKGKAEDWFPAFFEAGSGLQLRSAVSIYRSHVEQIEGPDSRLEAQPPWSLSLGGDARVKGTGWTLGASFVMQPGYATQQTDRQLNQRSAVRTLDAFASLKLDRFTQFRVGVVNVIAPESVSSNIVEDIDGFSAGSTTRRNALRVLNAGLVLRF
jgi:outer membrane receptor for ferrienterochelin and colicins